MSTAQRIIRRVCPPLGGLFLAASVLDLTQLRPHATLHWIAQLGLTPLMLMNLIILPAMRRTPDGSGSASVPNRSWGVAIIAALGLILLVELAVGATDVRHALLLGLSLALVAVAVVVAASYARWKAETRYLPRIGQPRSGESWADPANLT